jgi:lipoate-protein ligase A
MSWQILDTGCRSAEENMRLDAELLEGLDSSSRPILHLYDWAGESATYGYFVNPSDFLDMEKAREKGLQLARRPTGGGIIFHIWDFAFSVLVPAGSKFFSQNTLANYQFVNSAVLRAAQEMSGEDLRLITADAHELDRSCERFCMAKPTKYDVMLGGKKIAGAAQRQRRSGFLHQGSISLVEPCSTYLSAVLLPGTRVLEAMQAHTKTLAESHELKEARASIKALLIKHLCW